MSRVASHADILFPSRQNDINAIVSELRRNDLSISNRLRSIAQDAAFVQAVADELKLPLVANERCGSWYIDPARKAGSAYFKSTDGHFGQWSFSLRRLNISLLELVAKGHGCIIVDSTRRGKSMPDALSKTVPIWICVLNRLLFPEVPSSHALRTPEDVISASEHSQIDARINAFVVSAKTLALDVGSLRAMLERPLKPYWVTPDIQVDVADLQGDGHWPIVLCTASSRVSVELTNDTSYVQGAADDHESWAHGLSATTFWQYRDELLCKSEDELVATIARIADEARMTATTHKLVQVKPTASLFITNNAGLELIQDCSAVVYCAAQADIELEMRLKNAKIACVHLACAEGKNGSRQLRSELNKLEAIADLVAKGQHVVCSCQTGRNLAVGVALALLCRYFDVDGKPQANDGIGKAIIKQKLSWIMVSMPDAAPSRATLQSVNAYLMS